MEEIYNFVSPLLGQLDPLINSMIVWYITLTITIPIIIFGLDILNKLREYGINFSNILQSKELGVKKMYNLLFASYLLIILLYVISWYYLLMKMMLLFLLILFLYLFYLKIIKIFKYLESNYMYLITESNVEVFNKCIESELKKQASGFNDKHFLVTKTAIFEDIKYDSINNYNFAKMLSILEHLSKEGKDREILLIVNDIFYQLDEENKTEYHDIVILNFLALMLEININTFIKKVIIRNYHIEIKHIIENNKVDTWSIYNSIVSDRLLFLEYVRNYKNEIEYIDLLQKYINVNWFQEYKNLESEIGLLINIYIKNILNCKTWSEAGCMRSTLNDLMSMIVWIIINNEFLDIEFLWEFSIESEFEKKFSLILSHVFDTHASAGISFYNKIEELLIHINNNKDAFHLFIILRLLIIKTWDKYKYELCNLLKENINMNIITESWYANDLENQLVKKLWKEYFNKYYQPLFTKKQWK